MSERTPHAPVNVIGQELSTGDKRKLHRDQYAGEVLTKFNDLLVTKGFHRQHSLRGAKALKLPVYGASHSARVHRMGTPVKYNENPRSELTLTLDERMYDAIFLDELDEILADINVRSIFTDMQAQNLAQLKDSTIFRLMIMAARSEGLIPGEMPGGTTLYNAGFRNDPEALAKGIYDAAVEFKSKNVNLNDVRAFITPAQEAMLIQNKETINKDWGGVGSYADGTIARIGGIQLVTTNNLPMEDVSNDNAIEALGLNPESIFPKYRGDYSDVAAIIAAPDAVATVEAVELDVRIVAHEDSYGHAIQTSYVYGGGVYRPECAIELSVGTPP